MHHSRSGIIARGLRAFARKLFYEAVTVEPIAFWPIAKRRWWLVALPVLVVMLFTLPALRTALNPPARYEVRVRLTAAAPPSAEGEVADAPYQDTSYVVWLASEYVAVNLPHWITSDSFAQEVSSALANEGLSLSATDLQGAFAADSYRSIVTLFVQWDDAAQIVPIAQAAVRVLQQRNAAYFPQFAAAPAQVVALDSLKASPVPPPLSQRLLPLVRLAVGALAGLVLAGLAEYFDDRLRTRADVEGLGLEVLAEIPGER